MIEEHLLDALRDRLSAVVAIPVTPFGPDGEVDSDARMSGTSYGTCALHVTPESHIGGPLALVRTGDLITLDVPSRLLRLDISADELASRRSEWRAPEPRYERGYGALYLEHITQADEG
jgi:dihydroxyacid dehydratase/phosphogluconate dehydratase